MPEHRSDITGPGVQAVARADTEEYLTQCRIEEARRLLRTTELKVEEVARRVGFTSASHFAEVFRKHVGMMPREFRNRGGR